METKKTKFLFTMMDKLEAFPAISKSLNRSSLSGQLTSPMTKSKAKKERYIEKI